MKMSRIIVSFTFMLCICAMQGLIASSTSQRKISKHANSVQKTDRTPSLILESPGIEFHFKVGYRYALKMPSANSHSSPDLTRPKFAKKGDIRSGELTIRAKKSRSKKPDVLLFVSGKGNQGRAQTVGMRYIKPVPENSFGAEKGFALYEIVWITKKQWSPAYANDRPLAKTTRRSISFDAMSWLGEHIRATGIGSHKSVV